MKKFYATGDSALQLIRLGLLPRDYASYAFVPSDILDAASCVRDIKPLAAMHKIDPADAPPIPICVVTLKGKQGEKYERLDRFVSREFSLLKRMFNE